MHVEAVRPPDSPEALPKPHRGSVAETAQAAVAVSDLFRGSDKLRCLRWRRVVARELRELQGGAGDRAVLVSCLALRANVIAALQQVVQACSDVWLKSRREPCR